MPSESDAITAVVVADIAQFEKQMANLARLTEKALKKVDETLDKGGKRFGKSLADGGKTAAVGLNDTTRAAGQLSFQLNDIGQSLAGGMSPFMVMAQQGSQVSQVLSEISAKGGGIKNMASALGGAFASMVSPLSLATNLLILGAGYAASYFLASEEGSKKAKSAIDEQTEAINNLRKAQGLQPLDRGVNALDTKAALATAKADAAKIRQDMEAAINTLYTKGEGGLFGSGGVKNLTAESFGGDTAAMALVGRGIQSMNYDLEQTIELFSEAASSNTLPQATKDILNAFIRGSTEARQYQRNLKELNATIDGSAKATAKAEESQKKLNEAVSKMHDVGQKNLTDMEELNKLYKEAIENATTLGERARIDTEYAAGVTRIQQNDAASSGAADLIKKEEGFRADPYPDPKDLAIGYGMHQYIDEAGKVIDITNGMKTTVLEANEQLARQIPRYQSQIIKAIGSQAWEALTEGQQAALTSVTWNYGHLPNEVAAAIKRGDHGQAALAISNLTANPERRKREAAIYAGASGAGASDALSKADEQEKANKSLEEMLKNTKQELELREEVLRINKDEALSEDEKALAIAKVTAEKAKQAEVEKILLGYKEAGRVVDKEARDEAEALAQKRVDLAVAEKQMAIDQKNNTKQAQETAQIAQQYSSMLQGAVSGFITDLRNGVEAGEAFNNMLNRIIDSLINMALQMAFGKQGLGALFTGIAGGGSAAGVVVSGASKGGTIGALSESVSNVNPNLFRNAPRFQRGGVVGLPPGAVPMIGHVGEVVVPKALVNRMSRVVGSGGETTNVNNTGNISIDMSKGGAVAADDRSGREFGLNIQRMIRAEMVKESRPGGLLRKG